MLVRLIYASRSANALSAADADGIIRSSRAHNPEHGITGVLCYAGNAFMQLLEGSREEVSALFAKLVADPRHQDVVLLGYSEIEQRHFCEWSMGRVDISKQNVSMLLKYSSSATFDPYELSSQSALALFEDLINSAAVISSH